MNYKPKRFELIKSLPRGQEPGSRCSQGPPGYTQRGNPDLSINRILLMHLTLARPTIIRANCTLTRILRTLSAASARLVKECLLALKRSWQRNSWAFSSYKPSKDKDGAGPILTLLTKQPPGLFNMFTNDRKRNPSMIG